MLCWNMTPAPSHSLIFKRLISSSLHQVTNPLTIGIRREDPARLWERRCPLTPSAVEELVQDAGVRVLVQDCNRRVYGIGEFERAGASVHPNLSPAHIILGIKEIPLCDLTDQSGSLPLSAPLCSDERRVLQVPRTHLMFSHTGKGQPYNMPLLSKFISPDNSRSQRTDEMSHLIDYEFLTDGPVPTGKRVVAFGWFAGASGAVEGLCATAHDLLSFGVASPFLHLPRPYMSRTVAGMRGSLCSVGSLISEHGTPAATGPFVITITGNGNVAHGALAIVESLPHAYVRPEDLPALVSSKDTDLRKVYIVHAQPKHYIVPSDGSSRRYDRASYYARPTDWKSVFYDRIAPYTSLFINGAGWQIGFPRLMTNDQLASAFRTSLALSRIGRFRTVADVSCDMKGGLEFVEQSTTIDSPFYISRPSSLPPSFPGVQVMSVDILPTQIPQDASAHFSTALMPYLRTLIRQYQGTLGNEEQERVASLGRATIAQHGSLQGAHKWLAAPLRELNEDRATDLTLIQPDLRARGAIQDKAKLAGSTPKKKVLLLGSGMVARPVVEEFSKRKDVHLVVASNNVMDAPFINERFQNVTFKQVDLADIAEVDSLVSDADVVVSLLPAPFHPAAAKLCITHRKHMVTASYISPAMRELHESAVESDVLLLNEIGLDPGIDHCSAISLLQRLKSQNKIAKSFISFCGGLPAPEAADVPLGYKFSWSPRAMLNVALSSARFKLMGEEYNMQGEDLLQSHFRTVPLSNVFRFEGIANRDSLPYAKTYNIGPVNVLDTVLRGTLRYPGFCTLLHLFRRIGLLEVEHPILLSNWTSFAPRALSSKFAIQLSDDDAASFRSALGDIIDIPRDALSQLIHVLNWLGISPVQHDSFTPQHNNTLSILPPSKPLAPIDLLTMVLSHQLRYQRGERDMVVLVHEITVGSTSVHGRIAEEQTHTSTLIAYGTPSSSAMSRTVGLPVALATLAILDGQVHARGVHGPTMESVYGPVLQGLEANGLGMKEKVTLGGGSRRGLRDELWSTMPGRGSVVGSL
ncbi:Saccharopine dehydrogenase-domain-containing protein [Gautieria morchelliformis]|nr:Saccharopine dehydrogenase-domain-containing protein [Gautieria morchelliformis]